MKSFFANLEYRFVAFTAVLFLAATLLAQSFMIRQERAALETRLGEKAAFINTFYAFLIADALSRKDDVTLLQVISRLEEDQEISSVIVVDNKGEVRYHIDAEKVGTLWNDPLLTKALQSGDGILTSGRNSGGRSLTLISPLKVSGQSSPIGAVKIDMTYRHIDKLLERYELSLRLVIVGLAISCVGFMLNFVRRWFLSPLTHLKKSIANINPLTLEPNLLETNSDFGQVHAELNLLVLRLKAELQSQQAAFFSGAENEKIVIDKIARSLMPESRVLVADRDNRVLSDTGNGTGPDHEVQSHLLDLITDANFANLVGTAFQKEGETVKGTVIFQEKSYDAVVLCLPDSQSKVVKTLIALRAPSAAA